MADQGFKNLLDVKLIDVIEFGDRVNLTDGKHIFHIKAELIEGKPTLSLKKTKMVRYAKPVPPRPVPLPKKPRPLPRVRSSK